MGDKSLLGVAVLERRKGCVDLCFLRAKEVSAQLGGVSASERPWLLAFGHHCLQALPEVLLSVNANLKPSLFQFRTKSFDVGLHPERNECLPVTDSSTVLAVEQNPASSEVVHATADRTKGDIRVLSEEAIWRVDKFGPDKDCHDGLYPTLVRATWCSGRLFKGLAAFHMNEQARGLQMSVACEIEIVDIGLFQGRSLLWAHVRRKKQNPTINVVRWQSGAPTVYLINYDADVLMAEVPFFFDEVANDLPVHLPSDDAVEAVEWARWDADLGSRHPLPKNWLVRAEDILTVCIHDVLNNIMFINNELLILMNTNGHSFQVKINNFIFINILSLSVATSVRSRGTQLPVV